ncbi:MAG: hypothetical protein WCH46_02390 [bacterium]
MKSKPFVFTTWDPALAEEEISQIMVSLNDRADFHELETSGLLSIKNYEILKEYSSTDLLRAYHCGSENRFMLIFASLELLRKNNNVQYSSDPHLPYSSTVIDADGTLTRARMYSEKNLCILGYKKLQSAYGDVLIRPETMADRIVELVEGKEILFPDHPDFNKKYLVLAKDVDLFTSAVTDEFLSAIEKLDRANIEIHNQHLLILFKSVATLGIAQALNGFLLGIS